MHFWFQGLYSVFNNKHKNFLTLYYLFHPLFCATEGNPWLLIAEERTEISWAALTTQKSRNPSLPSFPSLPHNVSWGTCEEPKNRVLSAGTGAHCSSFVSETLCFRSIAEMNCFLFFVSFVSRHSLSGNHRRNPKIGLRWLEATLNFKALKM